MSGDTIIKRFQAIVAANVTQRLDIGAVSRAMGISGSSLRQACRKRLGISPLAYAQRQRLLAAHGVLRQADPAHTRVTAIATEHGFYELGRFSITYRRMFGESPSSTLRRAFSADAADHVWYDPSLH